MIRARSRIAAAIIATSCVVASGGVASGQKAVPGSDLAASPPQKAEVAPGSPDLPASGFEIASEALGKIENSMTQGLNWSRTNHFLWFRRFLDSLSRTKLTSDERRKVIQARLEKIDQELIHEKDRVTRQSLSREEYFESAYRLIETREMGVVELKKLDLVRDATPAVPPQQMTPRAIPQPVGGVVHGLAGGIAKTEESDPTPKPRRYRRPAGDKPSPADEARNKAILASLDRVVPMKFAPYPPLDEIVKQVREATGQPDGTMIPIYVDPDRRWEVETSPRPLNFDFDGLPLRTTLRLILKQIGLTYEVYDGMLVITELDDDPAESAPGPLTLEEKASNDAILARLEQDVPMHFPENAHLEEVLKYVQAATKGPSGRALPIYVEPQGLRDAGTTLDETVQIDLKGVPLRTTLRLILAQVGLHYNVREGMILIDVPPSEPASNPYPWTKGTGMGGMGGMGGMM